MRTKGKVASEVHKYLVSKDFLLTDSTAPSGTCIPAIEDCRSCSDSMLSWVNDVERTSHAAARLEYHHSSDTQTIIARARDLQDIRERWTVPTFMDGSGREWSALERVKGSSV